MDPAIGRGLLNGEDAAASVGALYEATKRLCAKKRIEGYGEIARGVCVSEFFKFRNRDVITGAAARPRDEHRRRAGRG